MAAGFSSLELAEEQDMQSERDSKEQPEVEEPKDFSESHTHKYEPTPVVSHSLLVAW